jgi:hypothetical protein
MKIIAFLNERYKEFIKFKNELIKDFYILC